MSLNGTARSTGSSRACRRWRPCRPCCSCRGRRPQARRRRERRTAASITRSPARSQRTASSGSVPPGEEYSGCAWSTYSRAPLVRITFAAPGPRTRRSSSLRRAASWLAARSVEAAGVVQRVLVVVVPAGPARGCPRRVGVDDLRDSSIGLASGVDGCDPVLGLDPHHRRTSRTTLRSRPALRRRDRASSSDWSCGECTTAHPRSAHRSRRPTSRRTSPRARHERCGQHRHRRVAASLAGATLVATGTGRCSRRCRSSGPARRPSCPG